MDWFGWEDDGSVSLTWNRPGPDLANRSYVESYLKHVAFWMDKGIAGSDVDARESGATSTSRRARHPDYIKARGGFVTSENLALENDIVRRGGFNAGTGTSRTELYNELQAMLDGDAEHIRRGMDRRRRLIELGMFPFQQFGDRMHEQYSAPTCPGSSRCSACGSPSTPRSRIRCGYWPTPSPFPPVRCKRCGRSTASAGGSSICRRSRARTPIRTPQPSSQRFGRLGVGTPELRGHDDE